MTIAVDWDVKIKPNKQTDAYLVKTVSQLEQLIYISNYIFHSSTKQACYRNTDFSQLEKQAYNRNTRFTTLTQTFTSCSHKPVHTCSLASLRCSQLQTYWRKSSIQPIQYHYRHRCVAAYHRFTSSKLSFTT